MTLTSGMPHRTAEETAQGRFSEQSVPTCGGGERADSGAGEGIIERAALFQRLATAARVTHLSALAGSGKTVLLRTWLMSSGKALDTAWVSLPRAPIPPGRLWQTVIAALRATRSGRTAVRVPAASQAADGAMLLEGLLEDLRALQGRVWLVLDDLHTVRSAETLQQLDQLFMRAPPMLRIVIAARHDVQLGLHRLRLAGELTEIRTPDLRFTLPESRSLLSTSGLRLSEPALMRLQQCTEGWAAGLRLAALALMNHPDPEGFAMEFSGSERTVAEYLQAEVLDAQPEAVKRLLLRTAGLERVNGALADHLTGGSGSEGMLRALERENAFVFALDAERCWFRYHPLFADFLRSELRHSAPAELKALQADVAEWYSGQTSTDRVHELAVPGGVRSSAPAGESLLEPISASEGRVLRYLSTNLARAEIAAELCVSVNTVKTHMSRLFAKLGVHTRSQAVERARRLGLLGISRPARPAPLPPRVNLPVAALRTSLGFARSQGGRDAPVLRHSAGMKLYR